MSSTPDHHPNQSRKVLDMTQLERTPTDAANDQRGAGEEQHTKRRQTRKVAAASLVGTTVEWYDFYIYGTAAALVFPSLIFPQISAAAGLLASLSTYAVGFAAR